MGWERQDGRKKRGEGSKGGRRGKGEAGIVGCRKVLKRVQQGWEEGWRGGGRGAQAEKGGD